MAKNNKGRDYLRPLPEDIEWVEIAAILDANAINIVSHEEMIEGADACYTTAAFLKGEEQALINGIKGSLALQKSFWPVVRKKSQEDKLEFICSMIPQCITNERARQQMSKRAAALRFMTANAVIVDENDREDLFTQRFAYYRKKIERYKRGLPKSFIQEHYGELTKPMPDYLLDDASRRYDEVLKELDPQELLLGDERISNLKQQLYHFLTDGFHKVKTSTLDDDLSMVALACSIPAEVSIIHSNDNDILGLTLFAKTYLTEENLITAVTTGGYRV